MNGLLCGGAGQLPPMSSVERVSLIQQRLRDVQHRWTDLKAEVAYIERKRRRAKRKEREGLCPYVCLILSISQHLVL